MQVIVFGTMALLGLRGPAWWLAVGWTLHPLWDVVLRYLGPGCSFAPTTYTIPCLSFDLLVAAYIAFAVRISRGPQARVPRGRYLGKSPLVAQATVCIFESEANFGATPV